MAKEGLLDEYYCEKLNKLIDHMTPEKSKAWYQEVQVHLPDHLKAILRPSHIQDGDLAFESEKKHLDDQDSTTDSLEKPAVKTTVSISKEEFLFKNHPLSTMKPAVNATKTISNDAFLLFRNQFTSAEKLVAKTAGSISNDELLSNALSDITISEPKPENLTRTPAPQPEKRSQASTVHPKPSRSNPFYRPDMTSAIAAQNIAAYFREAVSWLVHYHMSTPASTLVDLSRKPSSILNRIFANIHHTAEFLRFRRKGWDLRLWPDNFFEDVLPLVMITCGKLEKLGEWKGCERMMARAWKGAEEVGEVLVAVRNERMLLGRETWERRRRSGTMSRARRGMREEDVGVVSGNDGKLAEDRDEKVPGKEGKKIANDEDMELEKDENDNDCKRLAKEGNPEIAEGEENETTTQEQKVSMAKTRKSMTTEQGCQKAAQDDQKTQEEKD